MGMVSMVMVSAGICYKNRFCTIKNSIYILYWK